MGNLTLYRADELQHYDRLTDTLRWKPSIHMPRWACRLVLEITEVRVQRLRDISEEDALAEGVSIKVDAVMAAVVAKDTPARMEFWHLWESINAKRGFGWNFNPWVWALTFKRV